MLLAHVPATVRSLAEACLDLDGAQTGADVIGDNDVAIGHASRRERGNHAAAQQFAHDEMLARRTRQTCCADHRRSASSGADKLSRSP
jgi:hypothetical protein